MNTPLYYISSVRFPSEKAHALYMAKSMESFASLGFPSTIIVPRRISRSREDYMAMYDLKQPVDVVFLPALDLFSAPIPPVLAHYINLVTFLAVLWWYIRLRIPHGSIICTNDVSVALLTPRTIRTVLEVHDYPGKFRFLVQRAFRRVELVLSNNALKVEKLVREFTISKSKILAMPNGVDVDAFSKRNRADSRKALSLPFEQHIVLYTGHLYDWKGAGALAAAAEDLASANINVYFVGGTPDDVRRFKTSHAGENMHIIGHRPYPEIPLWLHAADVLVIPNSAQQTISSHYASPMKLFEYMASGTPIVASDTPSIREIVTESEAYFVPPDEPHALARGIRAVFERYTEACEKGRLARVKVSTRSWIQRARTIIDTLAMLQKK